MKRFLAVVLTVSLVLGCLTGLVSCGSEELEILTKGQWAEKISQALNLENSELDEPVYNDVKSDNTYYDAVQKCAAWDIFDKSQDFEPDERSTAGFAMASAVRAIGLDRLAVSQNYKAELQTEEEMIKFFQGNSDTEYSVGGALYAKTADEIIQDMNKIINSMQLENTEDVGFMDNCVELSVSDVAFYGDGETGELAGEVNNVQKGTIIILHPSETYPDGKAAKITSIEGKKFKYTTPPMEEVIDHVVLTGTYQPKVIGVIPMSEDVKVDKINGREAAVAEQQKCDMGQVHANNLVYVPKTTQAQSMAASVALDDIQFSLMNKSGSKGDFSGQANASLGLRNISVTADINLRGLSVQKAYATINSTMFANFNASGSYSPDSIPLAKVICTLYKVVTLEFQANLEIGASGEVTVDWSLPTRVGTEYKKGAGTKFIKDASGANLKAEAHAEAFVKPCVKGIFKVIGFSVASCGVYSGVNVKLDAKAETKKGSSCINLKGYIPLSCFAGGEKNDTLLAKIGVAKTWTIWDENSSKLKKEWHIENGKVVEKCTWEEEPEWTLIPQQTVEPLKMPDYDMPSFEEFNMKYFGFSDTMFYALDENGSQQIKIKLPEGYAKKDIWYASGDTSVVSVDSNGRLKAQGEGVTQIMIATKDGKRCQYCVARVAGTESVPVPPPIRMSVKRFFYKPLIKAC